MTSEKDPARVFQPARVVIPSSGDLIAQATTELKDNLQGM